MKYDEMDDAIIYGTKTHDKIPHRGIPFLLPVYKWRDFRCFGGVSIGKFGLAINNNKRKPRFIRYGHPAPMRVFEVWGLVISWNLR